MTPTKITTPITANGEYSYPAESHGKPMLFSVAGVFDGATVTPGYSDSAGNFVPFTQDGASITTTTASGWRVYFPAPGIPAIKVANATGTTSIIPTFTRSY